MSHQIINSDLIEWLTEYEGERFHGILSDPPYALISVAKRFGEKGAAPAQEGSDGRFSRLSSGFMGQKWDSFRDLDHFEDWVVEWAKLCIEKALYPGAVCAFFGGTRTYHRLARGLERGGFEIIDCLMWLYGSGFPKSHNLDEWEGYGTALKPAWEPIILCRAPRGSMTFAELAKTYGTGALNIDGSRILISEEDDIHAKNPHTHGGFGHADAKVYGDSAGDDYKIPSGRWPANLLLSHHEDCIKIGEFEVEGRTINRWTEEMKPFGGGAGEEYESEEFPPEIVERWACVPECSVRPVGDPARFFYTGKASRKEKDKGCEHLFWKRADGEMLLISEEEWTELPKKDRAKGNIHPSVKPLDLLGYLAKLLKPPDSVKSRLLVPFSGTGSEMIAAIQVGWSDVTGIEIDPNYTMIAEARIAGTIGMF